MLRRLAILLPLLVSTVAHAAGPGARAVGTFEH
ncbi:hypothetical protein SAMN04488144_101508 [Methylobacterium sp. 190mf]|nr:hypothetical protein SAMN04488144_101508 [Methylobacterium sp. 190mf]